jgi:hypothetical protein
MLNLLTGRVLSSGRAVKNTNSTCRVDYLQVPEDIQEAADLVLELEMSSKVGRGEVTFTNPYTRVVWVLSLRTSGPITFWSVSYGSENLLDENFYGSGLVAAKYWMQQCLTP